MAMDPGCTVRDGGSASTNNAPTWIDCVLQQKKVTFLITAIPGFPLAAKDFAFRNAANIYERATAGTDWESLKGTIQFMGGPGMPGFEPIAQLRLIAEICEPKGDCTHSHEHKMVDFKVLGTPRLTVALIVMGDVNENQVLENGELSATYWYFPDPVKTMVETFNFATMPNPPY